METQPDRLGIGGVLQRAAARYSQRARQRRALLFKRYLVPSGTDRILDLGSEDGSHVASIVGRHPNTFIADIDEAAVTRGHERFGFTPVVLGEHDPLPFSDSFFDIVFCSSAIEHVTVPKGELEGHTSRAFAQSAFRRQQEFADEIRRVGKRYFVQTPYKFFVIESHTWLPGLIVLLPRGLQVRLIRLMNRFWPKKTEPDWNLLTVRQMQQLFPDAEIVRERSLGLTKSIIAVKR